MNDKQGFKKGNTSFQRIELQGPHLRLMRKHDVTFNNPKNGLKATKKAPEGAFESALYPGLKDFPPKWRVYLLAVGCFTVRGDVQAFALCIFWNTQTNDQVNQFVSDCSNNA